MKNKKCMKCKYHGKIHTNRHLTTCDYMLITGRRRNCPSSECDKFVEATPENRKKAFRARLY